MSTLAVTNLKHESATGNNIVLASDGTATFAEVISASKGIAFPATQVSSANANTLDDYEEGSWTPSVGGTATYTFQTGTYTKIGDVVFIRAIIQINSIGTGSTTTISGLPFTSGGVSYTMNPYYWGDLNLNTIVLIGFTISNNTTMQFNTNVTSAATIGGTSSAVFKNSARIDFSGFYKV